MPVDDRAPCIIGVARQTWRDRSAPEPLAMWETVARAAFEDAGNAAALGRLGSIRIVYCQSWEYDDPCRRLADRLGADPPDRRYSGLGGSVPNRLVADAAEAMGRGELDLALVVGGEALATRRQVTAPDWSHPPAEASPFPISLVREEAANGIYQAYLTFALLDTARRAHLGFTVEEHRSWLGRLLAPLTAVAARDPEHAWFPVARDAAEIATVSASNRMVATPYTKLMTAIMDVDMAAAVLLATEACADDLGVPADRRVYLRGSGSAAEPAPMAARPELWRSPALAAAAGSALGGMPGDEVAHLDLYSCFASSLAFASDALGLGDRRDLTVTGGLPYHGGPGSDYGTHALAAMTKVLRADPGSTGLVTGVGMHMQSHSATRWSTTPGDLAPLAPAPTLPSVAVRSDAEGPATVATFSTAYSREGPEATSLICDLPDGSRCYARLDEPVPDGEDLEGASVQLAPGKRGSTLARR